MHEHGGFFCKTAVSGINSKITGQQKKQHGPKMTSPTMRKDNRKMGFLTLGLARQGGCWTDGSGSPARSGEGQRARARSLQSADEQVSAPGTATATWDAHAGELEDEWAPRLQEHGGAARFDARKKLWPKTMAWRSRGDSGSTRGRGSRGRSRQTWRQQQVPKGSTGLGRGALARLGRSGARGTAHGRTVGHGSMAQEGGSMAVAAVLVAGQRTAEHSEGAGNGQVGCGGGPERRNPKERRLGGGRPDLEHGCGG